MYNDAEFERELERELNSYLKNIQPKIKKILEDAIQSEVYDTYTPNTYDRTYQLLNNVETLIQGDTLYVYIDTSNMNYYSAVTSQDVGELVPYWINYGHHRDIANGIPMYDDYSGRGYLEKAKEQIMKELGIEVEIIAEAPLR